MLLYLLIPVIVYSHRVVVQYKPYRKPSRLDPNSSTWAQMMSLRLMMNWPPKNHENQSQRFVSCQSEL